MTPTGRVTLPLPLHVSLVLGLLTFGLLGCASTALARAPTTSVEIRATPVTAPTPITTPVPLPIAPPQIVAEAGVLPGGILGALDRFAELLDRTIFSFGIPSLRARIALAQAAERIAELQLLERHGQLVPDVTSALLRAHRGLVGIADDIVARQIVQGRASTDLIRLLVRTRFATAEIIEELANDLAVEFELTDSAPTPAPAETPDKGRARDVPGAPVTSKTEGTQDTESLFLARELEDTIEDLLDVEQDILPAAGTYDTVPSAVLRMLAEQGIAKAERELARALTSVEERLVRGRIPVGDAELRAAVESHLVTARDLFAGGYFRDALTLAAEAREAARRLTSWTIDVEPTTLRSFNGKRTAGDILQELAAEGFLSPGDLTTAEIRVHEAAAEVQQKAP